MYVKIVRAGIEQYGKILTRPGNNSGLKTMEIMPYSDVFREVGITPMLILDEHEEVTSPSGVKTKVQRDKTIYRQFVGFRDKEEMAKRGIIVDGLEDTDGKYSEILFDDIIRRDLLLSGLANEKNINKWDTIIPYPLYSKGLYILVPSFMEKPTLELNKEEEEIAVNIFIKMIQMYLNDAQTSTETSNEILGFMKAGFIPIWKQTGVDFFKAMKSRVKDEIDKVKFSVQIDGMDIQVKEKTKTSMGTLMLSIPFIEAVIGRIPGVDESQIKPGTFVDFIRECLGGE